MTIVSTLLVTFAVMLALNSGGCELCSGKCNRETEE